MTSPNFAYYVSRFFQSYLSVRKNASQNTVASYAVTLKLFFAFCEKERAIKADRLQFEHINETLIADFLDWLEISRGASAATRNQRLVALHSFFRYVQKNSPMHMSCPEKF